MIEKELLQPERVRRVPRQFSWVDQRLVRDRHLKRCGPHAWTLYLFLVTVSDARGLSYYSEKRMVELLPLQEEELRQARRELVQGRLVAYRKPLYQVLSLEPDRAKGPAEGTARESASASPLLVRDILKAIGGER